MSEIKFEMLKRTLASHRNQHYLLKGDDGFLLERSYDMIRGSFNIQFPQFNLSILNADTIDCAHIVESLETLPTLSDNRLVYLNISGGNTKLQNQNLLEGYFKNPNPSSVLVINAGQNTKLLTVNTSSFLVVNCGKVSQSLFYRFIKNEFAKNSKTINADALQLLHTHTNGYLSKSNNEVVKLVNYTGAEKTITAQHVLENVSHDLEFQIYELTENLARKNTQRVFTIQTALKRKKDGQRGVLALIYNHFRRLLHISLQPEKSSKELANLLGVKEYAITRLRPQVRMFSRKKLKQICDLCMDLEYKTKTSTIQLDNAISILIFFILSTEE